MLNSAAIEGYSLPENEHYPSQKCIHADPLRQCPDAEKHFAEICIVMGKLLRRKLKLDSALFCHHRQLSGRNLDVKTGGKRNRNSFLPHGDVICSLDNNVIWKELLIFMKVKKS